MKQSDFKKAITPLIERDWVKPTVDLIVDEMDLTGSHDLGHLLRVLRNAYRISRGEVQSGVEVDWEVLAASALLHDVVDLPKDHPERSQASKRSAELAVTHFERLEAFDAEKRQRIFHAIEAHSFSAGVPARSPEAQILCDADRLESIGAFGIARVFMVSGELGGAICNMADPFGRERELEDMRYTVDHFFTKMLKLKDRLYTRTARQIGARRHAFMEQFLEQLADEIGESL
jgi:uncharacterized protein